MSHARLDDPERHAWIALASTPGVGDVTFERMLATWGSAAGALTAIRTQRYTSDQQLSRAIGMRSRRGLHRALMSTVRDPSRAQREMDRLGGWILSPLDVDYPPALGRLEQPPRVLFGLGDRSMLAAKRTVAVVGTRRPSAAGRDLVARIVIRLAEARCVIVSGLALGIDGAAHRAALEAGAGTVAVIGSGPDSPGPAAHRGLAAAITRHGAIISELAPGVAPTPGTFPRRNRIISALARATIVVEAPARSGALITARHALEQGRTLLVAPGRPFDPRMAGSLRLLRESPAIPLVGLDEMLADIGLDGTAEEGVGGPTSLSAEGALRLLGPSERSVAQALIDGPKTLDGLVARCGLSPGAAAAALTVLQLRGWAAVHGAVNLATGPLLRDDEPDVQGTQRTPASAR